MNHNDCKAVKDLLDGYIDNELSKEQSDFVESHVGFCDGCAYELRTKKVMKESLADKTDLKAPEDFIAQLQTRIESENITTFGKSYISFFVKVAGILLISSVGFAFVYKAVESSRKMVEYRKLNTSIVIKDSSMLNLEIDSVETDDVKDSVVHEYAPVEEKIIINKKSAPKAKIDTTTVKVEPDSAKVVNGVNSGVLNIQGRSLLNRTLGKKSKKQVVDPNAPVKVSIALYPWSASPLKKSSRVDNNKLYINSLDYIKGELRKYDAVVTYAPESVKESGTYNVRATLPIRHYKSVLESFSTLGKIDGTDDIIELTTDGFVNISIEVYYIR